jgi:hypothetical protein
VNEDPQGPRPSSFEDLSDLDVHAQRDAVATGQRTAILITASVVLLAGALFAILYVVLLVPFATSSGTSTVSGGAVAVLIAYGVGQAVAGVLVLMLVPFGRWLGIVVGILGIVLGLVRATSTPASGLVSILLSAFVIYALASSGPSFRRG